MTRGRRYDSNRMDDAEGDQEGAGGRGNEGAADV